jgi:hypothetical protein
VFPLSHTERESTDVAERVTFAFLIKTGAFHFSTTP